VRKFELLAALEIRGYEKLRFLVQKAHTCVNPRRLSHFASKSVGGLTSRGEPEKSQNVTRGSHRNDVSPLTQGLRYRTACDVNHIDSLSQYIVNNTTTLEFICYFFYTYIVTITAVRQLL